MNGMCNSMIVKAVYLEYGHLSIYVTTSLCSLIRRIRVSVPGDVSKSVEELQAYKPKKFEAFDGVDVCRRLAMKYSNQLFNIYRNKEDRFCPPALDNK
ncbi:unnamed protein product [Linum tenue]|uniref:Uncharacterized protein n=1 Tax=Linum tenue TaxID=586396 RepID=A0AAV0QQS1_9ROSI|nr:unnamed protein product [Linum tenue]